jgi:hypothetical protein
MTNPENSINNLQEAAPIVEQPNATETPAQNESATTNNANPESQAVKPPSPELSKEEEKERGEVAAEVLSGLGVLYDVLPRDGKIDKNDVLKTIKELVEPLQPLGPAVKISIAEKISRKSLHKEPKEEFITTLMELETVDLWIYIEGLKRAGDKHLAEVRQRMPK